MQVWQHNAWIFALSQIHDNKHSRLVVYSHGYLLGSGWAARGVKCNRDTIQQRWWNESSSQTTDILVVTLAVLGIFNFMDSAAAMQHWVHDCTLCSRALLSFDHRGMARRRVWTNRKVLELIAYNGCTCFLWIKSARDIFHRNTRVMTAVSAMQMRLRTQISKHDISYIMNTKWNRSKNKMKTAIAPGTHASQQ